MKSIKITLFGSIVVIVLSALFLYLQQEKMLIAYYIKEEKYAEPNARKEIYFKNHAKDSMNVLIFIGGDTVPSQYTIPIKVDSAWLWETGWVNKNCTINQTWDNLDKPHSRITVLRKYDTIINGFDFKDCYRYKVMGFYPEDTVIDNNYSLYIDYSFGKQVVINSQRFFGNYLKSEVKIERIEYGYNFFKRIP